MRREYKAYHNYDRSPTIPIDGMDEQAFDGFEAILARLRKLALEGGRIFAFDLYPGVDKAALMAQLQKCAPALLLDAEDCALDGDGLTALFRDNLNEPDPVFGVMTHKKLGDCFIPEKVARAREQIARTRQGLVFVVGTGAALITTGDALFYFDISRWEIQLRYRAGMPNWKCGNGDAPILSKYKRGYFVEWRLADRHKKSLLDTIDYMVDANMAERPKMLSGGAFREALRRVARRPFRLKPYFDPGVWGGQWMKQVFDLDPANENYAWSFDGVPEENSLLLGFGAVTVELPCMDLVLYCPRELLGERVHARFGAEFPIRFDLLDTMEGGELSLQVHPLTEYIQEEFGMHYTQDESYYILDTAGDGDACVYLGVKEGIRPEAMLADLEKAQEGGGRFPVAQYINRFPVKKHDHVLIPAGTIHCAGRGTMVLEISATPYIFTFKLWDWGRAGLDGKPRPIHLRHGAKNIQWDRDTQWARENLIGQARACRTEEGLSVERTGLHPREFIQTCRYTFSRPVACQCGDSVHMLNLVEGAQATVTSPENRFAAFTVHYAETFIIPASVGAFSMEPSGPSQGETARVIDASIK